MAVTAHAGVETLSDLLNWAFVSMSLATKLDGAEAPQMSLSPAAYSSAGAQLPLHLVSEQRNHERGAETIARFESPANPAANVSPTKIAVANQWRSQPLQAGFCRHVRNG
jgi:hypothetical protein